MSKSSLRTATLRIFLATFFLTPSFYAVSQKDFRPGFVVELSGDTISGQVLYREANTRFEECTFLKAGAGEPMIYKPDEVTGYSVNNEYFYVSKKLPQDSEGNKRFVEVLVSGKASLLTAYGKFFLEKDKEIFELIESRDVIVKDGKKYGGSTIKIYRNVLTLKMSDCSSINPVIVKSILSVRSLTDVVKKYNECLGGKSFSVTRKQTQFDFGISVGYSSTHLGLKSATSTGMQALLAITDPDQFSKSQIVYPGLSFELKFRHRTSLHMDAFYQNNTFESTRTAGNATQYVTWKYQSINVPLGLMYYFQDDRNKFRPFMEGGLSLYFNSNSHVDWRTVFTSGGGPSATGSPNIYTPINQTLLYVGGGLSYKPAKKIIFMAKLRYETGNFDGDVSKNNLSGIISFIFTSPR